MTTQIAKPIGDDLALDFYMEERIGEKKPLSFWVQARHNANNRHLFTKTNTINQTSRSTTVLLISTITYQHDNETAFRKHGKTGCTPWGTTPRTPRNKRTSLSNMNPTSILTLLSVLETNPIPNMSDQQSSQNHNNEPNREN
ncbi:hypothetical protein F8M41_023489 [Gigaspora margarita]|uniref:Uncharacterized protein n=1 Tax=Gigaspora margarita TaxID=4874 RepID=A0A8H4AD87_GIGMA|nr:hypothetical protein F8M41_023489 [Gigaspora margarita]